MRLSSTTSPCLNCTTRWVNEETMTRCHTKCEKYIEYDTINKEKLKSKSENIEIEEMFMNLLQAKSKRLRR